MPYEDRATTACFYCLALNKPQHHHRVLGGTIQPRKILPSALNGRVCGVELVLVSYTPAEASACCAAGRYGEECVDFEIVVLRWCLKLSLQVGWLLLLEDDGMDVRTPCASIIYLLGKLTRSA